jgi:anti-sigma regulatory factor (Ser/Thr protein kinase)
MTVAPDVHLADGEHAVEFYAHDSDLVEVVVAHFAAALRNGDAGVIIATAEHCDAFEAGLAAEGVDIATYVATGQLFLRDAAKELQQFTIDGDLDGHAFDETIGRLIRDLAASGHRVRAYGEMVALLWAAGNVSDAIELERMWNQLCDRTAFSLLCAYPSQLMDDSDTAVAFSEMCALHRRVISGAPTPPVPDVTRRFPRNPAGPRLARRFVTETLLGWDLGALVSDCLLVVSELATNAIRHAGSEFTVSVSKWNGGVTLMVGDASTAPPVHREPDAATTNGRGLRLVSENVTRWGHFPAGVGKLVWAHVDPPGSQAS